MLSITNHQWKEYQNTVKYHLTAVSMANIKRTINNTFWQGSREKRTLTHCWWDCNIVTTDRYNPCKHRFLQSMIIGVYKGVLRISLRTTTWRIKSNQNLIQHHLIHSAYYKQWMLCVNSNSGALNPPSLYTSRLQDWKQTQAQFSSSPFARRISELELGKRSHQLHQSR